MAKSDSVPKLSSEMSLFKKLFRGNSDLYGKPTKFLYDIYAVILN